VRERRAEMLKDDVVRIAVMWSCVAVYWEAVGVAIVNVINRFAMLPLAYVAATLMMTLGRDVAANAIRRTTSPNYKRAVEVVYVAVSSVFGIMLWRGRRRIRLLIRR